jgi:hypothetical protein
VEAVAAGVDTWSVAWYVGADSFAADAMAKMATLPAPRSRLLPDPVAGHRVGWFPGVGLVFAEGHPWEDGLCPPGALSAALGRLRGELADRGIVMPLGRSRPGWTPAATPIAEGLAGIRRLDLTVDLRFDRRAEGLAVLAGVASVPMPRLVTSLQREVGGRAIETVYLKGSGGRRILGRWYDKGIESGQAERGLLIRPEDQRRFTGAARLAPQAVESPELVKGLFHRRFLPLWKASKGITVAAVDELVRKVVKLRDRGELTDRQAEQLVGYLCFEAAAVENGAQSTRYRRRALCRDLGLVLADGTTDEVEVDLHSVLEAALEAPGWDC